jgi:hypothetical protein
MSFVDDLKRAVVPREISDFTRDVEDFVRPVTDPVRSFVAKAVPRELKPVLPFIASSMVPLPGFMNFTGGQFLGGFGLDALTQKLMTDPEDEDTDIDYLSALMSGVARSTAAAARKDTTAQRFADPAEYGVQATPTDVVQNVEFADPAYTSDAIFTADPNAAAQFTKPTPEGIGQKYFGQPATGPSLQQQGLEGFTSNTLVPGSGAGGSLTFGDRAANVGRSTLQTVQPFVDPKAAFSDVNTLGDLVTASSQVAAGAAATKIPSGIKAAKEAEEAYQDYLNQLDERARASGEAFEEERKQAYLGTFRRRGIDVDTTLRVMQENGINVTREEIEESRATAARGGRIGFDMGGMSYKDVEERYAEGLTEKEYIRFIELSPAERREEMTRAGVLRDDMARGGRVGFAEGTQVENMTIGDFVKAEEARTKFLDQIQRKMQAQEFNMRQNQPSGIGRALNMMNPFDKDPMREQPIMDMKTRYMDMMFDMRKKSMEDATKLREEMLREEMRKKNRKDDFNNIVDMLDDRFSENRQQRKTASKGGRMTPEGDPISPDVPKGMQMDLRNGGFIPLGTKPRADDVPAMVGKNEFVLNDRAVSGIGKMLTGNPDPRAGARALYQLQDQMEAIV